MIYVTGDCHGQFNRFNMMNFPEQKEMTKNDTVIICGDFGGVWDYRGESAKEKYDLDWLENRPFTTVFVDGNHENMDRLYSEYPVKEWNGGKVHEIRPHVLHLIRGQVYTIEGKKFFAFGGARSHDISDGIIDCKNWKAEAKRWSYEGKMFRIKNISWWEQEMPSVEEMERGRTNLSKHDFKVDFVISHCCPSFVQAFFSDGLFKPDELTDYFQSLCYDDGLNYKKWFFGHYHDNRNVLDKFVMIYEQIIRVV